MDSNPIKYPIGDLELESGETIQDCQISACIHGESSQTKNNVILVTASLGGNHRRLDFLIGPNRALDTNRYCIIATDALGNGLSSSPSNSASQPGILFPKFSIRDMVASQSQLLDQLSIPRVRCVIGASMGGMQALQWAVSHSKRMDSIVALTPMARTPAWSQAITLISRQILMTHDDWKDGRISSEVWRGWVALLDIIACSTPSAISKRLPGNDLREFLETEIKTLIVNAPDPRDWIWQTLAYDQYDLGTTPGVRGGTKSALNNISVPTLILAAKGDLMNPEAEAKWAADHIPKSTYYKIPSKQGHQAATDIGTMEVNFMNRKIATFLSKHLLSQ